MRRRELLWISLAGAACGRSARPLAGMFPREVGRWRLARLTAVPLGNVPDDIRRLGAREAARATYDGPDTLELTLYDMTNRKSSYAALRLAREKTGSAPFYHDQYFGVAQSSSADGHALAAFAEAFEKQLAGR